MVDKESATSDQPDHASGPPFSGQLRFKFFLTGVILPILCFVLAGIFEGVPTTDTPWQSGLARHYVVMLLQWPGFAPFLGVLIYSLVCFGIWVVRPSTAVLIPIQLGIYAGVILTVQFFVLILITTEAATLVAAVVVGPAIAIVVFLMRWVTLRIRKFTIRHLIILTTGVAILIALMQLTEVLQSPLEFLMAVLIAMAAATPTLGMLTYIRAALRLYRMRSARLPRTDRHARLFWLGGLGWLATWAASWKFAVDIMLVEYSKLPKTDPNCYVASAAAHGHPWLVARGAGRTNVGRVNDQTRRLKFLEFALAAAFPGFHLQVRRVYDRVGPILATYCGHNIWFADVTYMLLKPAEYCALVVCRIAGISHRRIAELYRRSPN